MRIIIKNMVCPAHKYFVKLELERLGITYITLIMGEIELSNDVSQSKLRQLNIGLLPYGLELEYDERSKIVLKIKTTVNDYLDNPEIEIKMGLHQYIVQEVNHSFYYVNFIFLEETGNTIDRYFISKKIERAIELLVYYNLTLTEIAYQLNFNSEDELIKQFKSVTGLMPERFKKIRRNTGNLKKKVTA